MKSNVVVFQLKNYHCPLYKLNYSFNSAGRNGLELKLESNFRHSQTDMATMKHTAKNRKSLMKHILVDVMNRARGSFGQFEKYFSCLFLYM